MSPLASNLPEELLHMVFKLLDQPAVLAAAAVSRTWRATAVRDHRYYRAWRFDFPPWHPWGAPLHPQDADLDRFAQVVQDAEQQQYALGLSVSIRADPVAFYVAGNALTEGYTNAQELLDNAIEQEAQDRLFVAHSVIPVLRRAVPRVARLNISVDPDFADLTLSALSEKAPLLRDLTMYALDRASDDPGGFPLTPDLFAGSAPLLTDVKLARLGLNAPQPCFARVRSLDLDTRHIPGQLAVLRSVFPRIRHLRVQGLPIDDPLDAGEEASFQRLHTLQIGPFMDCLVLAPFASAITHIPDVSVVSSQGIEALAPIFGAPVPNEMILCEYVPDDNELRCRYQFSQLSLQLNSPSSVRNLDSPVSYDKVFELLHSSAAARTLTKVTIDDRLVRSLMEACPAMPLLEELCIVMIAWASPGPDETEDADESTERCACRPKEFAAVDPRPPGDSAPSVGCPRLSTLQLYAVRADTTVSEDTLAALSRAFGGARLELVLANGISLAEPDSVAASAFRSIRRPTSEFYASACTKRAARLLREPARLPIRYHERSCPRRS